MSVATAPVAHLKLNFNDRNYELEELPAKAQFLLKDISRLDQRIGELQFELRHLEAARDVYGTALRSTMMQEAQDTDQPSDNGLHQESDGYDGHN